VEPAFDNYDGPLQFIHEGETIRLGEDLLKILFVPGHSPGHVCFYCEAQSFVVAGDTLFMGSIGRTDLPGGDHDTLITKIKSQLLSLPDSVTVYSGHGDQTTIGHEKKYNPFLR
jgi:glyoxylase-like metal-dependent hydrolase (beta-lactamase superfamily II)